MRQSTTMDRPAKKPRPGERDRGDEKRDEDRDAIAGGDDDLTDDDLDDLEEEEDIEDEADEDDM
jgi:hypothetical protein